MNIRKFGWTLAAVLVLALGFGASPSAAQYCAPGGTTYSLIAGQHMTAGTVNITQFFNQLIVTYQTTGDWLISETHLHVATSLEGIPATQNGSPKPGQFAYSSSYKPGVTSAVYVVNIAGIGEGTTLFVGAHAVVQSPTFGGQTAWSQGPGFPGANWFMYSNYTVCREQIRE